MTLTEHILSTIGTHPEGMATAQLIASLRDGTRFPEDSSLNIINRLVREGRIKKEDGLLFPGSGFKPVFHIVPDEKTRKLFTDLKAVLPFAAISIWHTDAILSLMITNYIQRIVPIVQEDRIVPSAEELVSGFLLTSVSFSVQADVVADYYSSFEKLSVFLSEEIKE